MKWYYDMKRLRKNSKQNSKQFLSKLREGTFFDKIILIWEFIADLIRDLTIPPTDEDWSKNRALITIFTSPIFILL